MCLPAAIVSPVYLPPLFHVCRHRCAYLRSAGRVRALAVPREAAHSTQRDGHAAKSRRRRRRRQRHRRRRRHRRQHAAAALGVAALHVPRQLVVAAAPLHRRTEDDVWLGLLASADVEFADAARRRTQRRAVRAGAGHQKVGRRDRKAGRRDRKAGRRDRKVGRRNQKVGRRNQKIDDRFHGPRSELAFVIFI